LSEHWANILLVLSDVKLSAFSIDKWHRLIQMPKT
jgi:hypothetical protein